jgi:hypothetical protein
LVQLPGRGISYAAGDPGVGFGQLCANDVRIGNGDHANAGHADRHRRWESVEGLLGTSNQLTGDPIT